MRSDLLRESFCPLTLVRMCSTTFSSVPMGKARDVDSRTMCQRFFRLASGETKSGQRLERKNFLKQTVTRALNFTSLNGRWRGAFWDANAIPISLFLTLECLIWIRSYYKEFLHHKHSESILNRCSNFETIGVFYNESTEKIDAEILYHIGSSKRFKFEARQTFDIDLGNNGEFVDHFNRSKWATF